MNSIFNKDLILLNHLIYFQFKLSPSYILGIYKWGSSLYGTLNENSDLDYVIVLDDNSKIWNDLENEHYQYESENLDLHLISESYYKILLNKCDLMAMECYFQENPVKKIDLNIDFKLKQLRHSISSTSSNSYVKSKKKLTIEENNEINKYIGVKSLFHSIRIIQLGIGISKTITKEKEHIFNFDSNVLFNEILEFSENINYKWDFIHKKYKPIFNKYSTEFKKLAPKI